MELAGVAGVDEFRGVAQSGGPVEPLPESLADERPGVDMGATYALMDVLEHLLALACGDA